MNLSDKMTIPSHVMARQVGDETVILDLASGTYFGLNPVGARIWQLISEGQTIGGVLESVLAEFEVNAAEAERDLDNLVAELHRRELIKRA
jgi:coenzyme PQQ synthesis protein D (PqqD)